MTKERYHKIDSATYDEFKRFQKIKKKRGPFISVKVSGPVLIRRCEKDLLKALTRYIECFYISKKIGTYSGVLSNAEVFNHKEWSDIEDFENMLYDMYSLMYNEKTGKFETVRDKPIKQTKKEIMSQLREHDF